MKRETDQKMRPEESRQAAVARNSQHTATTKNGAKAQMNTYLMLLFRNRIHALVVEVSICLMVDKLVGSWPWLRFTLSDGSSITWALIHGGQKGGALRFCP
jgi:F0F1-type ATP synthase assembly protein I